MPILSRETQCSADFVRDSVAQARGAGNQALRELADARSPKERCAYQDDFRYFIPAPGQPIPHTIPLDQFHRPYQLCLATLEFTLYGYCIYRRFGWERNEEAAFSLRRPPIWRRVLRPAPLLAFTVSADNENVSVNVNAARRPGYKNKKNHILRLDEELQEQITRINQEQIAARSIKTRVASWFRRLRGK